VGESHPKVVGLEDAVAFLDQVFELLDQRDFNLSEKSTLKEQNGDSLTISWNSDDRVCRNTL
jgi:hypothetical protein